MANIGYYFTTDFIAQIKTALQNKYGEGITIHYDSGTDIIFSCPAVSDKVIRIYYPGLTGNATLLYYGDEWTSGTTITNAVGVLYRYTVNTSYPSTGIYLILGDNFIILEDYNTNYNSSYINYDVIGIIGKLSNGEFIACGYGGVASYAVNNRQRNTTTGSDISIITTLTAGWYSPENKIYKMPVLIADANRIIVNDASDNPVYVLGLYCASYSNGVNGRLGANYFLSCTNKLKNSTQQEIWSSLIVEW